MAPELVAKISKLPPQHQDIILRIVAKVCTSHPKIMISLLFLYCSHFRLAICFLSKFLSNSTDE